MLHWRDGAPWRMAWWDDERCDAPMRLIYFLRRQIVLRQERKRDWWLLKRGVKRKVKCCRHNFFPVFRVDVSLLFHFLCIYQPPCEIKLRVNCHERDITVLWKPYRTVLMERQRTEQWNQVRAVTKSTMGAHIWLMNNVKFAIFLYLSRSTYRTLLFDWVAFCVLDCALDELWE